jgi:hypothetical protein
VLAPKPNTTSAATATAESKIDFIEMSWVDSGSEMRRIKPSTPQAPNSKNVCQKIAITCAVHPQLRYGIKSQHSQIVVFTARLAL